MTNQLAVVLGLLIVIGLGVDYVFFEWANCLFLSRKMVDMIEWMAFWR